MEDNKSKNMTAIVPHVIRSVGNIGLMLFSLYILRELLTLLITIYVTGVIVWPLITFPDYKDCKDVMIWEDILTKGLIWPFLILETIKDPNKCSSAIFMLHELFSSYSPAT